LGIIGNSPSGVIEVCIPDRVSPVTLQIHPFGGIPEFSCEGMFVLGSKKWKKKRYEKAYSEAVNETEATEYGIEEQTLEVLMEIVNRWRLFSLQAIEKVKIFLFAARLRDGRSLAHLKFREMSENPEWAGNLFSFIYFIDQEFGYRNCPLLEILTGYHALSPSFVDQFYNSAGW